MPTKQDIPTIIAIIVFGIIMAVWVNFFLNASCDSFGNLPITSVPSRCVQGVIK